MSKFHWRRRRWKNDRDKRRVQLTSNGRFSRPRCFDVCKQMLSLASRSLKDSKKKKKYLKVFCDGYFHQTSHLIFDKGKNRREKKKTRCKVSDLKVSAAFFFFFLDVFYRFVLQTPPLVLHQQIFIRRQSKKKGWCARTHWMRTHFTAGFSPDVQKHRVFMTTPRESLTSYSKSFSELMDLVCVKFLVRDQKAMTHKKNSMTKKICHLLSLSVT